MREGGMTATAQALQFDLFTGAPMRGERAMPVFMGSDTFPERASTTKGAKERDLSERSLAARDNHAAALAGRKALIVDCIRLAKFPMTDRQIKEKLFGESGDMNLVRPRITELIHEHRLIECGEIVDPVTGDTVRRVWLA